ncbi:hypothetical protein DRQ36_06695 [bacterium]|nr:MAG: hypothetical protein DRQ36_06695 [bacterium]
MRNITLMFLILGFITAPGFIYAQGCVGGGGSDEGVQIIGYIQPQFEYKFQEDEDGNADNIYSFTFKRARLGVMGNIPYDVSYYLLLEANPFKGSANLLDAFFSYTRLAPYATFSIGKFKTPFSLERNTSCAGLHTIERSEVVSNMVLDRDMGIMALGQYKDLVKYRLGWMHGTGLGEWDNNTSKDLVARVIVTPIEMVSIGGSYQSGKQPPANEESEEDDVRTRYAGELEVKYGDFLLQGEYIGGYIESSGGIVAHPPDCTHDTTWYTTIPAGKSKSSGYWGQIMYMTPWNLQPIVKYEFYDRDTDTDNNETGIITFGFNYFINDWSRVQVNYLYKAEYGEGTEYSNDEILVQFQAMFQ